MLLKPAGRQVGVRATLPGHGHIAGLLHAVPNQRAGFATGLLRGQLTDRHAAHMNLHVNTVQQWAGQPPAVAVDLIGRAAAGVIRVAGVATGAGVHGGNQLKICWIRHLLGRS